jgi:phosphoglycolate phosphatase-like HAD superfamily hydrolase
MDGKKPCSAVTSKQTLPFMALLLSCLLAGCTSLQDPLPSWNDGPVKQSILEFVDATTTPGSPDYVDTPERIAVFDNDGTLWAEQPMYFQLAFVLDRLEQLAPSHPEWKTTQPFKAALENDLHTLHTYGEKGLIELLMATHTGMTTDEFEQIVKAWLATARHPRFNRPYTECVYQPMLELLAYLRANDYQTWIVSGGGIEFMRPWTEAVYGIPPQQVIGSSVKRQYEENKENPAILRLPEISFINDKKDKPVGIVQHIGRCPVAAFGNSDGDFQMLEWTTSAPGRRLGLIVHHTDTEREWAYDRDSSIGRLNRGLDEAEARGWLMADMKRDFKVIFPFELTEK